MPILFYHFLSKTHWIPHDVLTLTLKASADFKDVLQGQGKKTFAGAVGCYGRTVQEWTQLTYDAKQSSCFFCLCLCSFFLVSLQSMTPQCQAPKCTLLPNKQMPNNRDNLKFPSCFRLMQQKNDSRHCGLTLSLGCILFPSLPLG